VRVLYAIVNRLGGTCRLPSLLDSAQNCRYVRVWSSYDVHTNKENRKCP
jgi:hypothetical protein